jgi:large subunit ribosomal protein L21
MYAVIRAGGKQYRVAPGDVINIEKFAPEGDTFEFSDVLAVSGDNGLSTNPGSDVRVIGQVLGETRGDKVLVFHFKRKKQYKKLRGHRQDYTQIRINEIAFGGQTDKAPDLPARKPRKEKGLLEAAVEGVAGAAGAVAGVAAGATKSAPKKKTAAKKKAPAKKSAAKKSTKKK